MTLKAKVVNVTADKAKHWLALGGNDGNRSVSDFMVKRFAADMAAGRWDLNGEPLIFNSDQTKLLDGQHRLHAVVFSGISVPMLVVTGVSPEAFKTIDSGRARTFADVLRARGHKYANNLAGVANLVGSYEKEGPFNTRNMSKRELDEVVSKHPEMVKSVEFAASNVTPIVSVTVVAFCHYIFSQSSGEQAVKFLHGLCHGENLAATSPIALLRGRLIEESAGGRRIDRRMVIYLAFRSWNAFKTRERLTRLQIPRNGASGKRLTIELPKVA